MNAQESTSAAGTEILICAGVRVTDGGRGVRFPVLAGGEPATAFVIRYAGKPYAYLNRCAHVPIELDWSEGEFFESSGLYLMCATHGAVYIPSSGQCAGGPCRGGRLRPVALAEHDGNLYWQPDDYIRPPTIVL